MDFETARAALPGMTRALFGERVTVTPLLNDEKYLDRPDPDRPVMVDLPVRFDLAPAIEQIGGGRERPEIARASSENATLSIEVAIMTAEIRQGDRVDRVDPVTGVPETYRVMRLGEAYLGRLLVYLSRT